MRKPCPNTRLENLSQPRWDGEERDSPREELYRCLCIQLRRTPRQPTLSKDVIQGTSGSHVSGLLTEIFMWQRATKHIFWGEKAAGNPVGHFAGRGDRYIPEVSMLCGGLGLVSGQLDLSCVMGSQSDPSQEFGLAW